VRFWRLERRTPTRRAGALALGVAVVAAGCGNARHDFRVDKLDPAVRQVDERRAELATLLRLTRPHRGRDARVLRAQVGRLSAAMRRIATLEPPPGTEARFRRYLRANAALLSSLAAFVDAFASGSVAKQRQAGPAAQAAVGAADAAEISLRHALR
jgi:hypothetical protein